MQKVRMMAMEIRKLKAAWAKLKIEQIKDPDFLAAGGKQMQKNFDEYIKSLSRVVRTKKGKFRTKNFDDIWNTRIKYDNTIPSRIKQATSLSEGRLQLQKDMWLQNRRLFNNVIKEAEHGLGPEAEAAFDVMSDLYTASNNIIQRAPIDVTGAPGFVTQERLIKGAAGAVGAAAGLTAYKAIKD